MKKTKCVIVSTYTLGAVGMPTKSKKFYLPQNTIQGSPSKVKKLLCEEIDGLIKAYRRVIA